jgi:hypothetical protein
MRKMNTSMWKKRKYVGAKTPTDVKGWQMPQI